MKRIIFVLTIMHCLLSASLYAQKDVTQFLGIPVDGNKSEMIKKLKEKGYTIKPYSKDILVGEFNGTEVEIGIITNNNKVCRIGVADANSRSEGEIIIRFNKLYRQFQNNKKYMPASLSDDDYIISEDEDISYELSVHNKRYQAGFYQLPTDLDTTVFAKDVNDFLVKNYTEEQMANMLDIYSKKLVWFMIDKDYGKYYILMYYDNKYNMANGEEL
jgi:hypothetical protein